MAGALAYGAGAYSGLEDIMAQQAKAVIEARLQAQQDESARHNLASEGLTGRSLDQNDAYRRDNLASLDAQRVANEANLKRDDLRARAALRPAKSNVTPGEYNEETSSGAMPQSAYSVEEMYGMLDPETEGEGPTLDQTITSNALPVKPGQPANLQMKTVIYKGKPVDANYNPDTGQLTYQGLDITKEAGHYTAPDRVLTGIDDPDHPGHTIYVNRGQAAGAAAPLSATQETEVQGIGAMSKRIDDILAFGEEKQWPGIGFFASKAGSLHDVFGDIDLSGEGQDGQTLRSMIQQLKTEAAFARGGKQLTPTEQAALSTFLATVDKDPRTAVLRLKQFQEANNVRRDSMLPRKSGAAAPPASDPYQDYLNSRKPKL